MAQSVNNLRKEGKLKDAYQLALDNITNNPDSLYVKNEMAWVLYEYIKQSLVKKNSKEFFKRLTEISQLELGSEQRMFAANLQWQYVKWVNQFLKNNDKVDVLLEIEKLLSLISKIPSIKPDTSYSALIRSIYSVIKSHYTESKYLGIMKMLDFTNSLQEEDLHPFITDDKRSVMSLAEQLYITYSKALISYIGEAKIVVNSLEQLKREIEEFIIALSDIIDKRPDYIYPIYYKAQFLFMVEKTKESQDLLIAFVRDGRKNEFWAWHKLGEAMEFDNKEMALSCYCRGLLCPAPADRLIGLKESVAKLMVEFEDFNEAKTEINFIKKARKEKELKLSTFVTKSIKSDWYKSAKVSKKIKEYYESKAEACEELLFGTDKKLALITNVNRKSEIMSFILDGDISGFCKYKYAFKTEPKINSLYYLSFSQLVKTNDAMSKAVWGKKAEVENENLIKTVKGKINIHVSGAYGFVEVDGKTEGHDDYYVGRVALENYNGENGDKVEAVVARYYDEVRGEFGFRVVSVQALGEI